MKKCKIVSLIIIIIVILNNSISISNASTLLSFDGSLYSESAAIIDGDTGRVLYEKDGYKIRPMASTTKIMTLILALEYCNKDDVITISPYAAKMPDVQLGIKEGEHYRINDLYYSLMLESHNDVAVAIAEHIGGDVEGFANMMNKKANELGLTNTYFITSNGLDSTDEKGTHSTNAVELAKIMKYCVMESPKREEFKAICQTKSYGFTDQSKERSFLVHNKNSFLDMMDGVLAGKTGFTADAGYCYVVAVTKDDKTYIVALLGCGWPNNKNYKWKDSTSLLNYGINNYNIIQITNSGTPMKSIYSPDGTPNTLINTYITDYVSLMLSDDDKVFYKYYVPGELAPPIYIGDVVGHIDILVNDELIRTVNVYAGNSTLKKDYNYYIELIINTIL